MGQTNQLAEPPMGINSQGPEQIATRQSDSVGMPPNVEVSTMVGQSGQHESYSAIHHQSKTNLQRPRRQGYAPTTLGNPFHGSARLTYNQLKAKLRNLECQNDNPAKLRISWIQGQKHIYNNPKMQTEMNQAIKRIERTRHKAKYPIFYDINPLLQLAFPNSPAQAKIPKVDQLILQLRLTTLMRSIEVANITWALYTMDDKYYIKTVNKQGQPTSFNVQGKTLSNLINYIHDHLQYPAPFLIRDTQHKHKCLGAERIAKRTLQVMQRQGINVNTFKAHSIRGATATHMLKKGVPQTLVQARGGWSTTATMDQYYSRLHQQTDWEDQLLGEDAGKRLSANCAVSSTTVSQPEPTEEGDRGETEEGNTAQIAELSAQGVLQKLYEDHQCPTCGLNITQEASYRCQRCKTRYHIRCMATEGTLERQIKYQTTCVLCQMARGVGCALPAANLIIDVMGVCD